MECVHSAPFSLTSSDESLPAPIVSPSNFLEQRIFCPLQIETWAKVQGCPLSWPLCCGDNLRPPAGRLIRAVELPPSFICSARRFLPPLPCHALIPFSCDTRSPVGRRRAVTKPLCRLVKSRSSRIRPRSSVMLFVFFCSREKCRLSVFFLLPAPFASVTDIPTLEVRLYWLQNVFGKASFSGSPICAFLLIECDK